MNARSWLGPTILGLLVLGPTVAAARVNVEVWTTRGDDAVYQAGDVLEVRARTSEDAYLLVYEIDSEGFVRMLYPYRGSTGFAEAGRTYEVPPERANVELVVDQPVGQSYIVAIAARQPFRELPWYLRPYDMQAEQVGYVGMRDDEDGITSEGRIVGDPFVAMERIRRRVVDGADDSEAFATAYTTYYVHEQVRYPRYLCYDCHRPGRWSWWAGFDPYYTHCSVFDFRINWGWAWGPAYWYGAVPYYCYVVRTTCPPFYQPWIGANIWFSSWNGWGHWSHLWGDRLVRFKTDPPPGYTPPSRYKDGGAGSARPPGFLATDVRKGREGLRPRMVTGRNYETRRGETAGTAGTSRSRSGTVASRPGAGRAPGREVPEVYPDGRTSSAGETRGRGARPAPREGAPADEGPRVIRGGDVSPREDSPRVIRPRDTAPQQPRNEGSRGGERQAKPAPSSSPGESRGGEARPAAPGGHGIGRGATRTKG